MCTDDQNLHRCRLAYRKMAMNIYELQMLLTIVFFQPNFLVEMVKTTTDIDVK